MSAEIIWKLEMIVRDVTSSGKLKFGNGDWQGILNLKMYSKLFLILEFC